MNALRPPALTPEAVHVWQWALAPTPEQTTRELALLSPEESVRAGRFRDAGHRRDFIARRALLRRLLAAYLDCAPAALQFGEGRNGKPELAGPAAGPGLRFNASASGARVAVAVAGGREVGIDVEQMRAGFDHAAIVERYFAPAERAALAACAAEARSAAFFRAWVRKEAYVKARGEGLARELGSFDVRIPAAGDLPSGQAEPVGDGAWVIRELPVPPGYALAVCAEGADWTVLDCDGPT